MAMAPLTLIANPGSASRKYAVYKGRHLLANLHFEHIGDRVIGSIQHDDKHYEVPVAAGSLDAVTGQLMELLQSEKLIQANEMIVLVGLRIVAPSAFFLQDRIVDDEAEAQLAAMEHRAPLHIAATRHELQVLREQFPAARIVGVSDSAFHATKPDVAWLYGIPLHDADRFDIKRFGYHGISVSSVIRTLRAAEKLPPKVVVCHLGSGASVTAVAHGKSIDTTMGYSPLEGLIMATRTGTIDTTAVKVLQESLGMDGDTMQEYLNKQSGLLGISGRSSDIRELLQLEADGDHYAGLALRTYVYAIQKAIGQMVAVLGGMDVLVFTGTVGERSAVVRQRITRNLHYLDVLLDDHANNSCTAPETLTPISKIAHSRPVLVIPADETAEMVRSVAKIAL